MFFAIITLPIAIIIIACAFRLPKKLSVWPSVLALVGAAWVVGPQLLRGPAANVGVSAGLNFIEIAFVLVIPFAVAGVLIGLWRNRAMKA